MRPVDRLGLGEDLASLERAEIEFVAAATKADFIRFSNATRFAASPPRVLLLEADAKTFLVPGTISLSVGRNINAPHNRLMKRVTDLGVGFPALLFALPLIGVLALLIKVFTQDLRSMSRYGSALRSARGAWRSLADVGLASA